MLHKTLVVFLLIGFIMPPGIPLSALAKTASSSQQSAQQSKSSPNTLSGNASTTFQVAGTSTVSATGISPTFASTSTAPKFSIPQIFVGTSTIPDLSRVDWDKMVNASGTPVALNSAEALASLDISPDIKDLVTMYRSDISAIDGNLSLVDSEKTRKKLHKKQALAHLIAENLVDKGLLPADYFKLEGKGLIESADQLIDISKVAVGHMKDTDGKKVTGISQAELVGAKKIGTSPSGAIKDAEDARALRKYHRERVEYLKSRKDLPARVLKQAQDGQDKFESELLQKNYIQKPNGNISSGSGFRGILKWLFGWLLPEKALAYFFGSEDFESCSSLPCSFTTNLSWGNVTPSIDGTSKVNGVRSLKEVVTGAGGGGMKKSGLSSSEIRVQFKVWVPNPVSFGTSGYFKILSFQDAGSSNKLWMNVEDFGTPRLTIAGDTLPYTDTGLNLVPGAVNKIEVRLKMGVSNGDVDIWLNHDSETTPNYNGSGTLNTGTGTIDAVVTGLVYAPENGVSTSYFDDVIADSSFIGSGLTMGISTSTANGLAYLVNHQNTDGSWGSGAAKFTVTAAVLDTLHASNATGTSYINGIAWLDSYIADNNDYLAQQAKIVAQSGGVPTNIQTLIYALDESRGGFVFDRGYGPDPVTTAKALQALTVAGYKDTGNNPNLTIFMALYYLSQTQNSDGRWAAFEGGASSMPATGEILESLLPYKDLILTGLSPGNITIHDSVNSSIVALRNTQVANGSWENNLLNTAIAFYAMRKANAAPTYQNAALSYLQNAQAVDGSFANGDLYLTAKAVKALGSAPLGGAIGDPVITDITPLTPLQTGSSTSLQISITNNGNSTINSGVLRVMADTYNIVSIDLAAQSIVINPSSTKQVTVPMANPLGFVGDVKFSAFVEGADGIGYPNSRYDKTLTFAADPTGLPGLPIYFIAQKGTVDNSPALNVHWAQKNDPNRYEYLIMWRTVGSSVWTTYPISNTSNGAILYGPFIEDQPYEVTVGAVALDTVRRVYYADSVTVITSANSTKYATSTISGSVSAAGQPLSNILLSGNTIFFAPRSDANGNFKIGNIPYGAGALYVGDFKYEPFLTRFSVSSTDFSGVKVPTLLHPDTENPTVTDLSIFGGSAGQVPNKQTVQLTYNVHDDVGRGIHDGFVQSAKFEYYDPKDAQWHIIGAREGEIFGAWDYQWQVPANLLGTGYKLHVTVRDFSGKESAPAIYGPFEIIAGNGKPTFSFTPPGAGSGSQADLSYTIKWTAHDDSNASIFLFYDVDTYPDNGNSVSIATRHTDDFLTQYEWDTSGIANGTYYVRAIVSDNYNAGVAVTSLPITITHYAPTAPTNLYTEGVSNPRDVFDSAPKFSAMYNDPNSIDTAAYYRIQVATSTAFGSSNVTLAWDSGKTNLAATIQGSRFADSTYGGSALATSTTYYWRVKLWDNEDNEGAWSNTTDTFSITDTDSAPTKPTNLLTEGQTNPVNVTSTSPHFSAIYNDPNGGDRANAYQIQVSTSSAFDSLYWDSARTAMPTVTVGNRSPDLNYAGPTLFSGTMYYWRILFMDAWGATGAWSTATSTFMIAKAGPIFQLDTGGTLTTGLISYYKLESGGADFWGSSNGTDTSITYSTVNGKVNQGAGFNGSTSNISMSGVSPTSAASFAFWTKFNNLATPQNIITRRSNSNDWQMYLSAGCATGFRWIFWGLSIDNACSNSPATTSWQFWVVTYDGSNVRIYLNGTLDVTTPSTGNLLATAGNTEAFGKDNEPGGTSFLNGNLDEVGVWSKALSQPEITDLYNAGNGQTMTGGSVPSLSSLHQYKSDGTTDIIEGAATHESEVKFAGTLQSFSTHNNLELQIELTTSTFSGIPTATSSAVQSGQTAAVAISHLSNGSYKWRARVMDRTNHNLSAWQEFGILGNVDFMVSLMKQFQLDTGGTLTTGLISYYKLEDATDFYSTRNLTVNGTTFPAGSGKVSNAANFNGVSQNLDGGNVFAFERTDSFSISLWANRASGGPFVISKENATIGRGWLLQWAGGTSQLHFYLQNLDPSNGIHVNTTNAFTTGTWFHIVITYNATSLASGMKIYVNNVPQPLAIVEDNLTSSTVFTDAFRIGQSADGLGAMTGSVDEVGVWSKALSQPEITDLYNGGNGQTMTGP